MTAVLSPDSMNCIISADPWDGSTKHNGGLLLLLVGCGLC